MGFKGDPKLSQPGQSELGRSDGNRPANRSISHPSRELSRKARLYFDVEELTASSAMPCVNPNALAIKRVPGIFNDHKLRSVCRMT